MDLRFKLPFTCIVSGPTKAGKTTFVKTLIRNKHVLMVPEPTTVWWFYAEGQASYDDLKNDVIFIKGLPSMSLLEERFPEPQLVILDDLMMEMKTDLIKLFTKGCHHLNVSVIHIVQNLFFKGLRTSRVNSEYLILLKNPSDKLQVCTLAHQLYPQNSKYFMEAYNDATKTAFSYLLIDLTQSTPDKFRLRTNIFSKTPTVYTERL
jgi:hypothetical protein